MKLCLKFFLGFGILLLTEGCAVRQVALNMTSDILSDASGEIERETDWEILQYALPANLKTFAGLYSMDRENKALLMTLTKGYAAYAFGVHETLYFSEKFTDDPTGPHRAATIRNYRKSLYYGMQYLALLHIDYPAIIEANKSGGLNKLLASKMPENDTAAWQTLLYTGQAWVSLINLSKGNQTLVSQLDLAKQVIDAGCEKIPDFSQGFGLMFKASYEASRPKAMGGNHKMAKELFLKAMAQYPDSLLTYVTYMEKFLIPGQFEDEYRSVKGTLELRIAAAAKNVYIPGADTKKDPYNQPDAALNTIAIKRFELIKQNESRLF